MKWIVALLLIVNVVVYLWASQHQDIVNKTVINAKFDVNKEGMLMLSEMGDLKQIGHIAGSEQSVSALVGVNQKQAKATDSGDGTSTTVQQTTQQIVGNAEEPIPSTDKVATPTESIQTSSQETPQVVASCYQLGPFKQQKSWQAATQWMGQNGIEFRHVISESRGLQAVRVYLGPYQAMSSAESTIRLLKSRNLDHFVYPTENGSVRISLGYFTQQELAEKFLTYLQSINVPAKSELEYRQLGPFNWLVIPVGSAKEKQVINHDWAESAVGLSQVEC